MRRLPTAVVWVLLHAGVATLGSAGANGAMVSAGASHSCSVRPDTTVVCWGANNTGQLGSGAIAYTPGFPQTVVGLSNVSAISSGGGQVLHEGQFSLAEFSCALRENGTVACWGANNKGQLGLAVTGDPQPLPQDVPGLNNIVMISASQYAHACALTQQGNVLCWGYNWEGQIGNGQVYQAAVMAPEEVAGLDDAIAITTGSGHTCALRLEGTVVCWGRNDAGQLGLGFTGAHMPSPQPVPSLTDVVAIETGTSHSCALRANGTVLCWGNNAEGALGNGEVGTVELSPQPVANLDDAVAISVSQGRSTCALRQGGSIVCWGNNVAGQLGTGSVTFSSPIGIPTPQTVQGIDDAVAVEMGAFHSCAMRANDSVVCWGWNDHGQLGNGKRAFETEPSAVVELSDVVALTSGWYHQCALHGSGTVACWGEQRINRLSLGIDVPLGHYPTPQAIVGLDDVDLIEAARFHTCAVKSGGTVACWGENLYGQLGTDTGTEPVPAPLDVSGLVGVTGLALGYSHTCALLQNGSATCWGDNGVGALGTGEFGGTHPDPQPVVELDDATAIGAGESFSCALRQGGTVACWGSNAEGRLGIGTVGGQHATPQTVVDLTDALAISASSRHACALRADATVVCWGDNRYGQIGNGLYGDPVPAPETVTGLNAVAAVAVGNQSNCALKFDGTVVCWGANHSGQIGIGTYGIFVPTAQAAVSGLTDATAIATNGNTSCAVRQGGTASCWGYGGTSVLGNGQLGYSPLPITAISPTVVEPKIFADGFDLL